MERDRYRYLSVITLLFCLSIGLYLPVYAQEQTEEVPASQTPSPTATQSSPSPAVTASPSDTPYPTPSPSEPTATVTSEPSPSPTPTLETPTPTETATPSEPPPAQRASLGTTVYLPLIHRAKPYVPPVRVLYCDTFSGSLAIPDNDPSGVANTRSINDARLITDLEVYLKIDHAWVGDLKVRLTHQDSGTSVTLLDRPGFPATGLGCKYNHIRTIFDDHISSSVDRTAESKCADTDSGAPAAISGIFRSQEALDLFDRQSIGGNWTLSVFDLVSNDTGSLKEWCLYAQVSEHPAPPTPTPEIPPLPSSAIISGVTGKSQALPLDCESRSAVDWASYFGRSIGELNFFSQLPHSNNPDKGFVGNVYGQWGQIPPNDYGVHAEPVAELLRDYGLPAKAQRPLSWPALKAEIAAGRPVIVWIDGLFNSNSPVIYTPTDDLHTVVSRYEHTVIVTGYTGSKVYYLNGGTIYNRDIEVFLDAWSSLGNMAITYQP